MPQPLNLGIEDTQLVGDYEAAEAFLSDGAESITADPEELEGVEGEETKKPKPEPKKVVKKPAAKQVEEEEEETEEEEEEQEIDPFDDGEEKEEDKEDEEEEEEETEEDEDEEGEEEGQQKSYNKFESLAKDLFKLGVFMQQEDEEPIKTGEDLLKRFQMQGQMNATAWLDNFLGRFGDDRKELFEAIFISGVEPQDYLPVYNQVQDFENLDLTSVENQKAVFREFYKRTGLKPETIEKNLQKSLDYGDLEDNISELHEQIVEQDKQSLAEQRLAKEKADQDKKRLDTEYRTGLQKILSEKLKGGEIGGIPLTEQRAREVVDFLHTPKYKTPNGQVLTEFDKFILESRKPENIENRIKIALLKLDNFDFTKIEKKGVSKETNELFNSLAQKVTKNKSRATAKAATTTKGSKYFKL